MSPQRHVPPGLHVLGNTFGSGAIGENVMMPQAAPLLSAGVANAGPPVAAEVEAGVGSAEPSAAETVVAESEPRETTEPLSATTEPPLNICSMFS
jgi:hypothetical protein